MNKFDVFIAEHVSSKSNNVAYTACESIGRIGRVHDLPLPNRNLKDPAKYGEFDGLRVNNDANEKSAESSKPEEKGEETSATMTKLKLVEKLLDLATEKDIFYKVCTEPVGLKKDGQMLKISYF